jgi:GT2 family glycosyltransferase
MRCLQAQTCAPDRFEVIVICDGCVDGTVAFLQRLQHNAPFSLRMLIQEQSGPAAARNHGIAVAQGSVIVFIDDDVCPVPQWLDVHLRHHEEDERAVVIGPLSPGRRNRPIWVRWEDVAVQQQAMLAGHYQPTPRQFYTGNSSVRKEWLEAVGGFNGQLQRAEDIELAFRLADIGLHFIFDPAADGAHNAMRTYRSWSQIAPQYGRNDLLIAQQSGHTGLLHALGREYRQRRRSMRILARWCIGRPIALQLTVGSLEWLIRLANLLHWERPGYAACSAVWNLNYWQGMSETLGEREAFWKLVQEGV